MKSQAHTRQHINVGLPIFEAANIPVQVQPCKGGLVRGMSVNYPVTITGHSLKLAFVGIGNPKAECHAICFTDKPVADFPMSVVGPQVETADIFPHGTNFEVAKVVSDRAIEARVWRLGGGETTDLSAGAAAVAVASWTMGYTGDTVKICLSDREVTIEWNGRGEIHIIEQTEVIAAKNTAMPVILNRPKFSPVVKHDKLSADSSLLQGKQPARRDYSNRNDAPVFEVHNIASTDGWQRPPPNILDYTPDIEYSDEDNEERAHKIEDALLSYGVEAKVIQINTGPTVTQFGVEPGWDHKFKDIRTKDNNGRTVVHQVEISRTRVKVDRISSLSNDLALALAAPSIRIEAPIPGKSMVGIEVPNSFVGFVSLRKVIETSQFQKIKAKGSLAVALGKGVGGEAVIGDLTKMPHLLIAGATGSGKTVCLNALICCLLMNYSPDDIKFVMIDPKRVELTPYNSLPHLAVPVIVETERALGALRWLNGEMDRRYQKLVSHGCRNIEAFNKKADTEKLSFIVLVIDELADLMMAGFDEVEKILCRLAQMARAVGIHLVVATQRPSVDVITGLIKANFPTRISFAVASQVDSRTILDAIGAEKLLGRGDMLFLPVEASKPKRLQGCFVSDAELEKIVYFWNGQRPNLPIPLFKIEDLISDDLDEGTTRHQQDSLFGQAMKLAAELGTISASYLQRKLHIGYPRAARLADYVRDALRQESDDDDCEVPQ